MADYKLSELNSIDTIRSDDLLHVRVKKRPEMLGDEDRRMTYQDFLASFKLERFVQITGSTMTGDLGIVKLLYGGKAVFDPTGSSEINIGDVLKTFKINANGLRLTIADASRSATVYHTLNKPSPNELGMRTNEENDARYARLAVTNTFSGTQNIQGDVNLIRLRNQNANNAQYIEGVNLDGSARWLVGISKNGSDAVQLYNNKYDSALTIASNVSVNKSLAITGQVQPSDFSNLDARYFTQTVANQRFAQLAGDNTFRGINNFVGGCNIINDYSALILKNASDVTGLYLIGRKADGTNKFYLGTDTSDSVFILHNYITSTTLSLSDVISASKTVKITGQVQPSDWTNIDSRYIPAATLNNLAKINVPNTFVNVQTIVSDNEGLVLRNLTQGQPQYIRGVDTANASRWWLGVGTANSNVVTLSNSFSGTQISLEPTLVSMNKNLYINGQVQPQDWDNLDARYFTQSASDERYLRIRGTNFNSGNGEKWTKIATVVMPQSASTAIIEVFGGAGFNINTPHQAGKCEIVLRTSNGNPKGLNVVAWRTSDNTIITDIGHINTSGDTYDIYCRVGAYQNNTTSRVQSSSNASVQLFEAPQTFDEAPQGIVKGTIAKYYTSLQKPTPSDIGAYTKAETDQKIAQAISDSTDLNKIYPVGIVTWFNSNVDPNTALPGLTWTYLNNGVGRTIRIAAANGSDVATTGGSDSVTLSVGNLPSHTHSFSATTSSFDYGTKNTNNTGAHTHSVSGTANSGGGHAHRISQGDNANVPSGRVASSNSAQTHVGWTESDGVHTHSVSGSAASAGGHAHSVDIGAHSHTVSGNTGGTGSGSAFSVTNQFYKLMAWVRTA